MQISAGATGLAVSFQQDSLFEQILFLRRLPLQQFLWENLNASFALECSGDKENKEKENTGRLSRGSHPACTDCK